MASAQGGSAPGAAINTLFTVKPKILEDNPDVLLCCMDTYKFRIRFSGVSCFEIATRRCHIAVSGDPPNLRRLCLIPDRDLGGVFAGVPSPVKLRVRSSSTIKFNCSEDVNKQEVWGTLLWEVEQLHTDKTAINFPPVAADIPDDLPHGMEFQPVDISLPYVDKCNCLKPIQSPQLPLILVDMSRDMHDPDPVVDALQDFHLSEDESDDSQEQDGNTDNQSDDDDRTLSGQIFAVAGSTWQACYQDALDKCSALRRDGTDVETRAAFEPNNVKDKNAIKFEVFVENCWQVVGYCPGTKVPKLTRAMNKGDVTEIAVHKLQLSYCAPAKKNLYKAYVKIVKKGTWERDSLNYKYNSVIVT
ncbi:PREDICTED: uncharacterized protein LOC109461810 [Branchiostoma belcheri]|uniref:Uncharacterized protein LOC109461810 n=1 Tax=Branchiostoma belcheri TaxID=7741 RepID=A0A6P4XBI9_BRABE|nr:PREDICTED: uncharacterized protein LOC109461810 [Branchiostoma belcheri]